MSMIVLQCQTICIILKTTVILIIRYFHVGFYLFEFHFILKGGDLSVDFYERLINFRQLLTCKPVEYIINVYIYI